MKMNLTNVSEMILAKKTDDEIIKHFRYLGYNHTAVWQLIQRCKIKLGLKSKAGDKVYAKL